MGTAEAIAARRERLAAVGLAVVALVLLPAVLAGVHVAVAAGGAVIAGAAVVLVLAALERRRHARDPFAPSAAEVWLAENPDDWPWWIFGGLIAALGLLLLPGTPLVLPLVPVGGAVAALPWLARQLGDCSRVRTG
jgi:hypothetical protein